MTSHFVIASPEGARRSSSRLSRVVLRLLRFARNVEVVLDQRFPRRLVWAVGLSLLLCFGALIAADVAVTLTEKVIASAEKKYGPEARTRLVSWTKLIAANGKKSETEKLKLVNDFFNQIPFVSDMEHWGLQDYWATPVELLASNGGDCEDYAIGKYFTLLALGFPMDRLRINYVMAINQDPANQAHMVLTYYPKPDAVPFILDNLIKEIKLASARPDLIPVYSFNGEGLWLAKERSSGKASGSSSKISLWTQMNDRMGKEL